MKSSMRALILATCLAVPATGATAQVAGGTLDAILQQVSTGCLADAGNCAALVQQQIATLRGTFTGTNAAAVNAQIAAVVAAVANVANTVTDPAARQALGAAIAVAAAPDAGFVGTPAQTAAQVAAVTQLSTTVSTGGQVTQADIAAISSSPS